MSMKQQKKKKGQSTLEYIILVTGVVVVLLAFLAPGGVFNQHFCSTMSSATNGMLNMAERLGGSRYKAR